MKHKKPQYCKLLVVSALCIGIAAGCGGSSGSGPNPPTGAETFSFENDLQGWSVKATDVVDPGNPPAVAQWSIQRSQDRASAGRVALKLFLNNFTDAGKIWVERPFAVRANRRYGVGVRYAFATADYGDIGLWQIITGVIPRPAQTRDDLIFQGNTGNGVQSNVGYRWFEKSNDFDATSGADGRLFVHIGVWGTFEVGRTYYIDNIRVTLREI